MWARFMQPKLTVLHLSTRVHSREIVFYPPANFAQVHKGIFRSGFPTKKNFPFLAALKLKTIVYMCQEEYPPANLKFAQDQGIELKQFAVEGNKEPFTHLDAGVVSKTVEAVLDPANHPVLIHCNQGKHRTGCVVGCVRKRMNWSLASIFNEYRRFSRPKERFLDEQFIELF